MKVTFDISHIVAFLGGIVLTFGITGTDRILDQIDIPDLESQTSSVVATFRMPEALPPSLEQSPMYSELLEIEGSEVVEEIEETLVAIATTTEENAVAGSLLIPGQALTTTTGVLVNHPVFYERIIEGELASAGEAVITKKVSDNSSSDTQEKVIENLKEKAAVQTPSPLKKEQEVVEHALETTEEAVDEVETQNSNTLPEGVYLLPSGQYVDVYGKFISGDPTQNGYYIPKTPSEIHYSTPSGIVTDRLGNILSVPKVEKVYATPTEINLSNLPEFGSAIFIPNYITISITANPFLTCDQLRYHGNEGALCELYKSAYEQYLWEVIRYE